MGSSHQAFCWLCNQRYLLLILHPKSWNKGEKIISETGKQCVLFVLITCKISNFQYFVSWNTYKYYNIYPHNSTYSHLYIRQLLWNLLWPVCTTSTIAFIRWLLPGCCVVNIICNTEFPDVLQWNAVALMLILDVCVLVYFENFDVDYLTLLNLTCLKGQSDWTILCIEKLNIYVK